LGGLSREKQIRIKLRYLQCKQLVLFGKVIAVFRALPKYFSGKDVSLSAPRLEKNWRVSQMNRDYSHVIGKGYKTLRCIANAPQSLVTLAYDV